MNNKFTRIMLILLLVVFATGSLLSAPSKVAVIRLTGEITTESADSVISEIGDANSMNVKALVLDMDVTGGDIEAASRIADSVDSSRVPVIAFVNKRAWSAGALIALSAPKLVFSQGATMGAAQPADSTDTKVSALAATFKSWAEKNNRSPVIAAAMVDPKIEVTGLSDGTGVLTLTAKQAQQKSFSDYTAVDSDDLMNHFKLTGSTVVSLEKKEKAKEFNWLDHSTRTVTTFWASTALLTLGLVCLFLEVLTLNGVLGSIGIASLLVFFLSHIAQGHVPWWIILVFFVGLALLAIEVFVTPGWGVMGIMGLILMFASIFVAIGDPNKAAGSMMIAIVLTVAIFWYALKKLPKSKIWKRLSLETTQSSADGYNAIDERIDLEGAMGSAFTDLRPGGVALLNDERVDVVTRGEYVKKDSPVRVIKIDGMRIVVEPMEGKW